MKNLILLLFLSAILVAGCTNSPPNPMTNSEKAELEKYRHLESVCKQNKVIVREVFKAIDSNDFDKLGQLLAGDFVLDAPGLAEPWKKEMIFQAIKTHYASFPDWTHSIEDLVAEGDKVMIRGTGIGTNNLPFKGMKPTGRKITQATMSLMIVVDGKVKHWWALEDNLGYMQQLGMELKKKD